MEMVLGNLEKAAELAAKQNFDQDVLCGCVSPAEWSDEDTKLSYLEEARDLLETMGENYKPRACGCAHIKYRPIPA